MATAILAALASVTLPVAEVAFRHTQERELRLALRTIRAALDRYKEASDRGRIARAADASGYPPTLRSLVDGEVDATDPAGRRIYFLRRVPRDPFADSAIAAADSWGLRSYASTAFDPKPGADVFDVHSTSQRTGSDGVPYREW
ncbi:MAG: general secretion pathway protein GspG [Burkholderiaceae bacterium]|nr:general secretion pathway protein GspG [Burkholderiaceae bacterium]